jgi:hypothetical protein
MVEVDAYNGDISIDKIVLLSEENEVSMEEE